MREDEFCRGWWNGCGGAKSHDIEGGLLDPEDPDFRRKKKELDRSYEESALITVSSYEWTV